VAQGVTTRVQPELASTKKLLPAAVPHRSAVSWPEFNLGHAVGNRAVAALLESGKIQAKLRVSQPGDADEVEADRVAARVIASPASATVHRKCTCAAGGSTCPNCKEEELVGTKGIQRKQSSSAPGHKDVQEDFLQSLGTGQPLAPSVRSSMEPHFNYSFSNVRIHADAAAAKAAQEIDAVAFTHGTHIFFGKGQYSPESQQGRGILAHELTHVVQQSRPGFSSVGKHGEHGLGPREQGSRDSGAAAAGNAKASDGSCRGALMRLTPAEFQKQLGATADQKTAIATLFANKTFLGLWSYLKGCTLSQQGDLGPLTLKVSPGLKIRGVERYGGYDHSARTLEINPTKPEHKANTAELVDTIVHELIHAVDDLADDCKKAGAGTAPLAGAATSTAPSRASVAGTPQEKQLMLDQGPGASNPCEEFLDINKAAQQMVIQIIRENIQVAKVGRPTVVFVNEILRQDPKAMKAYVACRDAACAKSKPEDQQKEMAACSADIIARFMPKSLTP
jgi:hypothetical protein